MIKLVILVFLIGLANSQFCEYPIVCQVIGRSCNFIGKTIREDQSYCIAADNQNTSNIRRVSFHQSSIYEIPSEIFALFPNLEVLEILNQGLNVIKPNTFKYAKNLITLDIDGNHIKSLERGTFEGAEGLQHLILSNNEISEIDGESFDDLKKLQIISLDSNRIQQVDRNLFSKLDQLLVLSIAGNGIEFLHRDQLKNNGNLEWISMSANKIRAIPTEMFSHLEKLKSLELLENLCISKNYKNAFKQISTIESDLRDCESNLAIHEFFGKRSKFYHQIETENFTIFTRKLQN
jgi:Leucine-rich repeat (LRR) protein